MCVLWEQTITTLCWFTLPELRMPLSIHRKMTTQAARRHRARGHRTGPGSWRPSLCTTPSTRSLQHTQVKRIKKKTRTALITPVDTLYALTDKTETRLSNISLHCFKSCYKRVALKYKNNISTIFHEAYVCDHVLLRARHGSQQREVWMLTFQERGEFNGETASLNTCHAFCESRLWW